MLLYARGGLSGVEKFTIQDLLNDLEHFLESQIKSSQTHFVIDNHVDEIGLRGNQQMLLSALINLSMNAIHAMGRGGSLCVDVRYADATTLQLRIIDNGPGIDKDVQRKIFNPFYTTRKEGTGLGLAVVAAVVRAHEVRFPSTRKWVRVVVLFCACRSLSRPDWRIHPRMELATNSNQLPPRN